MRTDGTAHTGVLEDEHGLGEAWRCESDGPGGRGDRGVAREGVEDGVEVVHRVAELVGDAATVGVVLPEQRDACAGVEEADIGLVAA